MDDRGETIERLFHAALERAPQERAAFLAREAPNADVAAEVRELLGFADASGDALDRPPTEADLLDARDGPRPDEIGPYRIERTLGHGGFGVVLLAEQTAPVRRRVALKLVKRGMDSEEVVRRFEQERQALALLDHPGIAKVLDAGVAPDGRPYFAMEYVEGQTLGEHCDARRLDADARLALFVDVCAAVTHAHQKGILHRDLKPSNVLVRERDGAAAPVVIDFGLAKALHAPLVEDGLVTRAGSFVGTPEFASPEQLASDGVDVDTRTDVYSLGAMLYHLLTGELPIDTAAARAKGLGAVRSAVCEVTPAPPSRRLAASPDRREAARRRGADAEGLARRLRGDLDLIALKALAKDREERYASVAELAADVRRHLAHEPVLAAPPDLAYQARKFVRRHRTGVLAGAALAVTLLAGLAGTATGWRQALRQRDRADAARRDALAELAVSRAIDRHLHEVLAAANPWARSGLPDAGREVKVVDLLALASERATAAFAGLPAVEASVRRTLGENLDALGLSRESEAELRRALELARAADGDDGRRTVEVEATLASTLEGMGRYAEAEPLRRRALAWFERRAPEERGRVLELRAGLARLLTQQERFADAEALLRGVLVGAKEVQGPTGELVRRTQFDLASLCYALGRRDEAETLLREALAACRATLGDDAAETIDTELALGGALATTERSAEALALLEHAVEAGTRVLTERHPVTLKALGNLGQAHQVMGDLERAEPLLQRAVDVGSAVRGATHPHTLHARVNLGLLQRRRGRAAEAERNLRECLEAAEAALGPGSVEAADYRQYWAYALHDLGRHDEAEAAFRAVLAAREAALGDGHPATLVARNKLALFLFARDRDAECEAVLLDALERGRAHLPPGDPEVLTTYEQLVALRDAQGRGEERQALEAAAEAWRAAAR